ncbi:MAG: thiamine pyrophosphate-dependent enzyme [Pseudomonadota bacterium]
MPPARPVAAERSVTAAARMLSEAKKPILMVGGGAQGFGACVNRLAEHLDAAVVSSNAGKGVVPESHALSLVGGMITKAVRDFVETADVILSIGCEMFETDSFEDYLTINAKLIRVDIDSSKFNDIYPADLGVQGDAKPTIEAILSKLQAIGPSAGRGMAQRLLAVRDAQTAAFTHVEHQHRRLLLKLRSVLPEDAIMMGDIAQLVYTGSAVMPTNLARTWFYPAGLGTLGCAMPGAIGAKLAQPNRAVVALVGDGGFLFTIQELATAVEQELSIPIILWNNNALAMIRDGMIKRGIPEIGVTPKNPDFITVGQGFGCVTARPESLDAFGEAVTTALSVNRPTIIEVGEDAEWLVT